MENKGTKKSCQCQTCRNACQYKPGWFKFGEVEKTAKFLKLSLKKFFDKYLMIDWWTGSEESNGEAVFIISPGLVGEDVGEMAPYKSLGTCVFFEDGKCSIHSVKPFECAAMLHESENKSNHKEAMLSWNNPDAQQQIKKLLEYEPYERENEGG
jgi:Fe-S-cluster containining protein